MPLLQFTLCPVRRPPISHNLLNFMYNEMEEYDLNIGLTCLFVTVLSSHLHQVSTRCSGSACDGPPSSTISDRQVLVKCLEIIAYMALVMRARGKNAACGQLSLIRGLIRNKGHEAKTFISEDVA